MKYTDAQLKAAYQRKILNQELSLKEFTQKKTVVESKPSMLLLELSYEDTAMDLSLFKKVTPLLHDAYNVDIRGFESSKLENSLEPMLDELLQYPLVNWQLLPELTLKNDRIWEKCIEAGFMIGFLCAGATQKSVQSFKAASDQNVILHNLKTLSNALVKYQKGLLYFIVMLRKENLDELPQIIKMAKDHGASEVHVKVVTEKLNFELKPEITFGPIQKCLETAVKEKVRVIINDHTLLENIDFGLQSEASLHRGSKTTLNFPPPPTDIDFMRKHPWDAVHNSVNERLKVSVYEKCFKPYYYVHITNDGKIGPCNHMLESRVLFMGSLQTESFEEIWNGFEYQKFRHDLVNKTPKDSRCQWCFQYRISD